MPTKVIVQILGAKTRNIIYSTAVSLSSLYKTFFFFPRLEINHYTKPMLSSLVLLIPSRLNCLDGRPSWSYCLSLWGPNCLPWLFFVAAMVAFILCLQLQVIKKTNL